MAGYFIKRNDTAVGTFVLPSGTTAERPSSPIIASIRYNTDLNSLEYYNGSAYVNIAKTGHSVPAIETFTGDGITQAFTTVSTIDAVDSIVVFITGVYQVPTTTYTVLGNTVTFTSVPPNGEQIVIINGVFSTWVTSTNIYDATTL